MTAGTVTGSSLKRKAEEALRLWLHEISFRRCNCVAVAFNVGKLLWKATSQLHIAFWVFITWW